MYISRAGQVVLEEHLERWVQRHTPAPITHDALIAIENRRANFDVVEVREGR
jgi:hypothetical protein